MAGMLKRVLLSSLLLLSIIGLSGCGDDRPDKIAQYQQLAANRIDALASEINSGKIRNAVLLKQYAEVLETKKPELSPLLEQLSLDATTEGPIYQGLKRRMQDSREASNFIDLDAQLNEVENIYQAADPSLYNDMLSDPLNAIADMSDGALARINAMSKASELLANGSEDFGAGSQLVGNPSYGSWQTNSSGTSFWAWYGMYSMFSNLFHRPIYYDNWSSRRGYSYYGDYGRNRYTSPKQHKRQDKLYQNTKKRFNNQGRQFKSPYAKTRTGSSSLSRSSQAAQKSFKSSGSKFRSNYSNSAKSSSSGFRNSSSRTSRGVRRGK
ncbi:hypothetical protein SOPP22_02535 [Shewanella sp. OPT22]|nr:hypothetical protein SOPP22_02535 [Shewanella sp. OPT22]